MTEQTSARFEVIRSPEFKLVYVNNVSLHATEWDVHLTFGELYKDIFGKEVLEQRVVLSMSPQMAKAVAVTVWNGVTNYEAQMGEIHLPIDLHIDVPVPQQPSTEPSV